MKKIYSLAIVLICSFVLVPWGYAQTSGVMKLSTSLDKGKPVIIELSFDGTLQIDWGNGELKSYESQAVADAGGYIEGEVCGPLITISHAEGIKEVYLNSLQLTSVECDGLSKLELLSLARNSIAQLVCKQCPQLKDLNVSNNQLSDLTFLKGWEKQLIELRIAKNLLTQIDLSGATLLEYLDASENQIEKVSLHPTVLKTINLKGNKIGGVLKLSQMTSLNKLQLSKNQIQELDLSGNEMLEMIEADNNLLEKITVDQLSTCKIIDVSQNKLDPCALLKIFEVLPSIVKKTVGKDLLIKGNPNVTTSRTQVAIDKGWTPDTIGDNTGCETAVEAIQGKISEWIFFSSPEKILFPQGDFSYQLSIWTMDAHKVEVQEDFSAPLSLAHLAPGIYLVLAQKEGEVRTMLIDIF